MRHTEVHIRLARQTDAPSIAQFNVALAAETESKPLNLDTVQAGVTAILDRPASGFYLVATVAEQVVGCLLVTYEWSDWRNANFWWIQSVYVAPAVRRQGVFRQLYDHVRAVARVSGDSCGLRLYVEERNEPAQRTYAKLGMRGTGYRVFEEEFR